MRTTKTYRIPDYALNNIQKLKASVPNSTSDSNIIAYALALSGSIMDAWNDLYKDDTSKVKEPFNIQDTMIAIDILKALYRELGHKDH